MFSEIHDFETIFNKIYGKNKSVIKQQIDKV